MNSTVKWVIAGAAVLAFFALRKQSAKKISRKEVSASVKNTAVIYAFGTPPNVRLSGGGMFFPTQNTVPANAKVSVLETKNNYIRIGDNQWLSRNDIELKSNYLNFI